MTGEPATEASVNGGRNYNGPKVAKFLVGHVCEDADYLHLDRKTYEASLFPGIGFGLFLRSLGGGRRRPPFGGARAIRPTGQGTVSGRQFLWGVGLPKGNGGVQRFPRARWRLALEYKGRRELDCKTHPLIFPKSSHRWEGLAPRCRLFATWGCSMFQGLGCSPIKAVRELGSERRETVWSISGVGIRTLRGPFPSMRGPGRTHLWCASYRAHGKRWVAKCRADNC
ncbi:hypothetical protein Ahy_B06g082164 [Arachis hypogaea]|uniref:Uncharacterized protein n=1 Tax=Arachis hypogaea TaxID=3818 RepID=A0A444YMV8_ARAHY|nr:hypothetical protein Ahy_B06g082164 [Arachis hypogaea]